MRFYIYFKRNLFNIIRRNITSKITMDIKTFAFLDTETTGLPYQEYNKTKLTELSLIVVQTDHISLGVFPRVQNKISFCFNPSKMINPIAEELTGLSNFLLEYQPNFNQEAVQIIKKFLDLQRKPVCFVAHNGNGFDYPILRTEIDKTGESLGDDILCIDTLVMFRELHKKRELEMNQKENEKQIESEKENQGKVEISPNDNIPPELCDGFDEILVECLENYEKSIQKINETTPHKGSQKIVVQNSEVKVNLEDLYFNPNKSVASTSSFSSSATILVNEPKCRRKLINEKVSFKLGDIYERLTNKSVENAHKAEDDCNMLLECAATLGQEFVDWANENAKRFCDIPMMKPGRKIGT